MHVCIYIAESCYEEKSTFPFTKQLLGARYNVNFASSIRLVTVTLCSSNFFLIDTRMLLGCTDHQFL